MPPQTTHPSPNELSAFSLGQLPPDEAAVIESHISHCQPCCETMLGLSSDDTFVALLQTAKRSTDQTADQHISTAGASSPPDVPAALADHPRYAVLGLVGRGGMGDVYRARHRMMDRLVALKIIKRELVRKPEAVERFHREVKTAAQLSHPNIVTAYDAEQAGDVHFLVMEFVDGVDLSQTTKERSALPIAEACEYIRQAAIGLQHAHERGMVHRDIKPHNLMVTSDGTVKILDFGLASLTPEPLLETNMDEARSDLTAAGAIMGTPDFISPEQADDARGADIRSDIYSLGATLYFLLAGRPPFADGSVLHKLKSHAQVEPELLDSLRDDIPADLAATVAKMIAKDPNERFQTPSKVAEALSPFAVESLDGSSAANQAGVSDRLQVKPSKARPVRRPLVATAFVGLVLAAIATTVFFIHQAGKTTLRFEINDPSVKVSFADNTIRFDTPDSTFKIEPLQEQKFVVYQGETEVETDSLTLRRGQKVVLTIDVVKGQLDITSNDRDVQVTKKTRKSTQKPPGFQTVFDSDRMNLNWPTLRIANYETRAPLIGTDVQHVWSMAGKSVGELTVRLLHISDGQSKIANESVVQLGETTEVEATGEVILAAVPRPNDKVSLSLNVVFDGVASQDGKTDAPPLIVERPKGSASRTSKDGDISVSDTKTIYQMVWMPPKPNFSHSDDVESMVEASKQGAKFVVITVDWKPDTTKWLGPKFNNTLFTYLSEAASIPQDQFDKLARKPGDSAQTFEGKPLSLLLLELDPFAAAKENPATQTDFRFLNRIAPKPRQLADAMSLSSPHGYVSLIQPEYIKHASMDFDGFKFSGTIEFEAPNLYAGKANFMARGTPQHIQVVEFELPNYGITIARDDQGIWRSRRASFDLKYVPEESTWVTGLCLADLAALPELQKVFAMQPQWSALDQGNVQQVLLLKFPLGNDPTGGDLTMVTLKDGSATGVAEQLWNRAAKNATRTVAGKTVHDADRAGYGYVLLDKRTVAYADVESLAGYLSLNASEEFSDEFRSVIESVQQGQAFVIANTETIGPLETEKQMDPQNPFGPLMMGFAPIWQDTQFLSATLTVGDGGALRIAAHCTGSRQQDRAARALQTVPVFVSNILTSMSDQSTSEMANPFSAVDPQALRALTSALKDADVTQHPGRVDLTIALGEFEPHLFRLAKTFTSRTVSARAAAYNAASESNLKQIGLAFHLHHQARGYFPSVTTKIGSGKHPVSWRVAILPFISDEALYEQYNRDEPWDSPNNLEVMRQMPSVYRHPSQPPDSTTTSYVVLDGERTATGDGTERVKMRDIRDGTSYTLLAIEAKTSIPWTKPEDIPFDPNGEIPALGGLTEGGWNAVFADGSTRFFSDMTDPAQLKAWMTRDGREDLDALKRPDAARTETMESDAWKKDMVAFEEYLGKLSSEARVPGQQALANTSFMSGYVDPKPAEDTVQFCVNEALRGQTVKWEFELGRYPQTEEGHLRLIPQSVLKAFESLSTSKEEIADVYPRLHELVLRAPFQAPEDVQLLRGDRVTVEGTIGDFAFQGSSKYPSPAFSGAVTIYHQIHVFDRSKKAPHPVFWIGLDNATITLDRANRVAIQIENLKRPLAVFKLDIGTYPSTKQGLKALVREPADGKTAKPWGGPYLKELPTDPWGNEFEYEFRGTRDGRTEPIIWSRGPDGTNDTDDDIKSQ